MGTPLYQSWLTIHWTNPRQRGDNSVASPGELRLGGESTQHLPSGYALDTKWSLQSHALGARL